MAKTDDIPRDATYRRLLICCGRKRCKKCRGEAYAHGPYWYAEWKLRRGRSVTSKVLTRYIGKRMPRKLVQMALKTNQSYVTRDELLAELQLAHTDED
jgi:hypothetical protein